VLPSSPNESPDPALGMPRVSAALFFVVRRRRALLFFSSPTPFTALFYISYSKSSASGVPSFPRFAQPTLFPFFSLPNRLCALSNSSTLLPREPERSQISLSCPSPKPKNRGRFPGCLCRRAPFSSRFSFFCPQLFFPRLFSDFQRVTRCLRRDSFVTSFLVSCLMRKSSNL